jgi:fumarylacetoacetase
MTQNSITRSWVASANGHSDFPLQNLPLGVFSLNDCSPRAGVAIGEHIFDLQVALEAGLFDGVACSAVEAMHGGQLNAFFELGREARVALRERLIELFSEGSTLRGSIEAQGAKVLPLAADCQMHLPARISDYTDFYVGIEHAQNVGKLFRPDNPLLPNYKHVPIGYHGRASTVRASGTDVRRPKGQTLPAGQTEPVFGPCARLDYELELGIWIGQGNEMGEPIAIGDAAEHIAGFCLLNDWSARDIQAWEYQPLGPFLSKSFITSVSPWVVMAEALEPFRTAQPARPEGDPQPLPYLLDKRDQDGGAFDIELEVLLRTGPSRKWSRTTASTAASCRPVTCLVRALCPARKTASLAACWRLPRAVRNRSNWLPAKCANSLRTVTKSSCALAAPATVLPRSASANVAAP